MFKKGQISYRKGHTKENDASIASMALKISQMKKGKKLSCDSWNKGLTKETDERVAKSFTPERSQKLSDKLKGRKITWHDKLVQPAIERFKNPAEREASRQTMLKNFQNPQWVKALYKARNAKPNKAEKNLQVILDKLYPNEWEFVGDGKMVLGGKIPDFVNVNGKKEVIELYGRYWHRNENPQDRIDLFKTFGYSTLIIYDNELKKINRDALKTKILNFSNGT